MATIGTIQQANAYQAITQMRQQLQDPGKSRADRRCVLKFLVHLVGDVHQPLHAGHANDQGGNKVQVKLQART